MTTPQQDYYAWTQETAEKLRQGRFAEVNMEDLIEELEDMGRSEKRALESRLSVLIGHLLKWQHQPKERSYSWQGTITGQRVRIKKLLGDNPSLRPQLSEFIVSGYEAAVQLAVADTNMPEASFPATFEQTGWRWEQVLDMDYLPE